MKLTHSLLYLVQYEGGPFCIVLKSFANHKLNMLNYYVLRELLEDFKEFMVWWGYNAKNKFYTTT